MKQIETEYAKQLARQLGEFTQEKVKVLGAMMYMDVSWNPTSWEEAAPAIYEFDQGASDHPITLREVEGNVDWIKIDLEEFVD